MQALQKLLLRRIPVLRTKCGAFLSSMNEGAGAQWIESIGEIGQNLETLKAYNSGYTEFWGSECGFIGFLVKFSFKNTPWNEKCDEICIKICSFSKKNPCPTSLIESIHCAPSTFMNDSGNGVNGRRPLLSRLFSFSHLWFLTPSGTGTFNDIFGGILGSVRWILRFRGHLRFW